MEHSSPLAAMQPPSLIFRHYPYSSFDPLRLGPNSFNFKDLSAKHLQQPDYFSSKPVIPASSPSASLAADLSQNFHIDQRWVPAHANCALLRSTLAVGQGNRHLLTPTCSPQLATPRKSLFSGGLLPCDNENGKVPSFIFVFFDLFSSTANRNPHDNASNSFLFTRSACRLDGHVAIAPQDSVCRQGRRRFQDTSGL